MPNCPFCKNNNFVQFIYSDIRINEYQYFCKNHKYPVYFFMSDFLEEVNYILIYGKPPIRFVKLYKHCMFISLFETNKYNTVLELPIDHSLTPENLDKKIKLYLTFQ